MIRNQRVCLPEATTDTFVMETEYPFEKYLLPMSMNYVSSLVIDKPIGRDDSLYDSDQVMEELLSESPRVGGFMHHFLAWISWIPSLLNVLFFTFPYYQKVFCIFFIIIWPSWFPLVPVKLCTFNVNIVRFTRVLPLRGNEDRWN